MKNKLNCFFIVLALFAGLAQNAHAAVSFTITPAAVSNTFSGTITLAVGGLTVSGDTVIAQAYLDANTNGIIDAGDILWQQFQLTDGQQSLYHNGATVVTNFNVPGDTDGTSNSAINAKMVFQSGSPQTIAGKYAFRLYSPLNHFTPITNLFTVTNFPYAGSFTGNVVSNNTAATLSNAIVLLFDATGGNLHVVGGAVANNAGSYTIKAPPGTYTLAAIRSNFVANTTAAANLVLGTTAITTNINLTVATQSITGRMVDANNSNLGIAGFLVPAQTQGGLLAVAFTETNGNFTERVTTNQWKVGNNEQNQMAYGYLSLQNSKKADTTSGSVSGITNALPKATAIFYGSVKDNLNHALVGISLFGQQQDNNYLYESQGTTDANGNYVACALAGNWGVYVGSDSNPTNYVFSQGSNNTLTNGQAYLQNFIGILATNHITGHVSIHGAPITNLQISANANIGPNNYSAQAYTDNNGNYSLNVVNTNIWSVNVSCNGGNNSLDNILGSGNYVCPNNQNVSINNNSGTANFVVQPMTPDVLGYYVDKEIDYFQTNTGSPIPDTTSGPYNAYLTIIQSSLGLVSSANVTLPTAVVKDFPPGNTALELDIQESFSSKSAFDAAYPPGNYSFAIYTVNNGNQFPNLNLPPFTYPGAPHISNYLVAQTINPNIDFLVQWDSFTGGINTNGTIWFYILDTNGVPVFSTPDASSGMMLPETATAAIVPAGTLQFGNSYLGVLVFSKGLTNNTTGYPNALGVTIAGTATTFSLKTISTTPTIGQPTRVSATQFGFTLGGVPGSNYTVLTSTNLSTPLSNWLTLLITNLPAQSAFIQDSKATNRQRFYRILNGP